MDIVKRVIKKNGSVEAFSVQKINKIITWACEGVKGVSISDIEINAQLQIGEEATSKDIHEILIESAKNLICLENINYQIVASRLMNYQLRKDVWGGKNPPKLYDLISQNVENGVYDKNLLELFSKEDINKFDEWIDHDRDFDFDFCGIKQLCSKYLVKNRKSGEIYETPQFAFMLVAMVSFHTYSGERRNLYIKNSYNKFSKKKINLPTPLMAGVRTPMKQYASCNLIDVEDSIDGLVAANSAVVKATSQRFGIGINMGRIRAGGSEIRNGDVIHTGVIPFLKWFESAVKSCHQNGIRGGGGTVNFPIWHYEIEDILQLKNNAGTDSNRVRNLDYCIHYSKLFYDRWLKDERITLFSPHEVKDLYEEFGREGFDEVYRKYEKDQNIKIKKTVKMRDLMTLFVKEKTETGRYYLMNIDHVNSNSAWVDKVNMTNLCVEINHPTIPLKSLYDGEAEVGICVLSAINLLEIASDSDLEKTCDIIVRMLDNIIDYQDYFIPAAERFCKNKRSLGIGITNLAALLAKNNLKYSEGDAPNFVDELMEKIQFFLLKSSNELAKEIGACKDFSSSTYSLGVLPIDRYKKEVDKVVTRKPTMDWESLRSQIKEHGLRHCTLTALMPVESSSVIQSSTNGIEPIRDHLIYKGSRANTVPVIAPHYHSWKNKYELAFDMRNNIGFINIMAALQKWVDMSISGNLYYNYEHYEDGKLPDTMMIKELLYAHKMGIKTLYYTNTPDGDNQKIEEGNLDEVIEEDGDDDCAGGACKL